jgi:hypothetical protein
VQKGWQKQVFAQNCLEKTKCALYHPSFITNALQGVSSGGKN